jgi:hypothetical protein
MWASFAFPHKPLIIVVLTGDPQTTGYCWWIIWRKCSEKLARKSAPVVAESLWIGGGRGTEGSVEKLGCQQSELNRVYVEKRSFSSSGSSRSLTQSRSATVQAS